MAPSSRYTIVSSDTHAGGSHAQYREFLEAKYLDDFDAWRAKYKNPFKDLGDNRRYRNWDNEMRNGQQDADGVVGEVIFPNTVPPFFPGFVLFAPPPKPEDYEHRLAGIRAHNRWLEDFCGQFPERRAGIGQIFVNDLDDAIADVKWIKEHNLRGGVLLPTVPPDATWLKPYNHPDYDRLWAVCEDLGVPVNCHGGIGGPEYIRHPSSALIQVAELGHYSRRPLIFILLSGVFERFPNMKFVLTEMGCAWIPAFLQQLDHTLAAVRNAGAMGELRFRCRPGAAEVGDRVLPAERVARRELPRPRRRACGEGDGRSRQVHVGLRLPARRGHVPVLARAPASGVLRLERGRHAQDPRRERGAALRLRPARIAPLAEQFGPTVDELQQPLLELPEGANEALRRVGASTAA